MTQPIQCSAYVACSLDGFIAGEADRLDWLPQPDANDPEDYGFAQFLDSIDVLIMGRRTWEMICSFQQWPYGDRPVIVLSHSFKVLSNIDGVEMSLSTKPLAQLLNDLANEGFTHAYVDGGQLIQSFIEQQLLNDLIVTQVPVLIGQGIPLFRDFGRDISLKLLRSQLFDSGLCQQHYQLLQANS